MCPEKEVCQNQDDVEECHVTPVRICDRSVGLLSFYFGGSKSVVVVFPKTEHTPVKSLYFVNRHNVESTKIGHNF